MALCITQGGGSLRGRLWGYMALIKLEVKTIVLNKGMDEAAIIEASYIWPYALYIFLYLVPEIYL